MDYGIKIIYKNKNTVIINKPIGMPSQPDPSKDKDAMSATSEILESLGEASNLWLVHRLDRTVGGLIAFARNKKSGAALSETVKDGNLEKRYFAELISFAREHFDYVIVDCAPIGAAIDAAVIAKYRDYLFKDAATNKAYVVKTGRRGAKEAVLYVSKLAENESFSLVAVELKTGRFHQIRAQFSSRGNSLVGDKKYGSRDEIRRTPCLFSHSLSFELFGKRITAYAYPDLSEYPWNLFSEKLYTKKENKGLED